MILNRLVTTEGNNLCFRINHTVNGKPYELSQGERYYIAIAAENDPDNLISIYSAPFADIEVVHQFSEGRYVFEISVGDDSFRQVIMPALDDKKKPLTQLIVLRRISND